MNDDDKNIDQGSWKDFLKYGHIFSPSQDEQFQTIISLIPAQLNESFVVVDLGCGAGVLSSKILEKFPRAQVVAIDMTDYMLEAASKTLAPFGDRATIRKLDMKEKTWLSKIPDGVRCFVSSLALHHLTAEEKKKCFKDLYNKLNDKGAVFIVDIVEPASEQVKKYFGELWDSIVERQSKEITGSLDVFKYFKEIDWNYYHWNEPDEEDHPSELFQQLKWLEAARFTKVDCFWMRAGHAMFGGYK